MLELFNSPLALFGSGVFLLVLPALLVPFLYIYLVHDYSGRRLGKRDPLLGAKIFTYLLLTIGGQLILSGTAALAVGLFYGEGSYLAQQGLAHSFAGAVMIAFPSFLHVSRLKGSGGANVARQALGLNAIIAGIVTTVNVVILSQELFHGGRPGQPLAAALPYALTMVWAGSQLFKSDLPMAQARKPSE